MLPSRSPEQAPAQLQFEEEFKSWKQHPTTKKLMVYLEGKINDRKDAWASGELLSSFAHEQFVKEAVAKGFINACKEIITLEAKDLEDNE